MSAWLALLAEVRFEHPIWLWAWPFAVLGLGLARRHRHLRPLAQRPGWRGTHRFRHPRLALLRALGEPPPASPARHWGTWRLLPYAGLLLGVHLALAGPYRLGEQLPAPPAYRDTLLLIDTSVSLSLRDYQIDGERVARLSVVKAVLGEFIDRLAGSRIGLVIFSEEPYTLAPLTPDRAALKSLVARIEPAALTGRTTDLGRALLYVVQQLELVAPDGADTGATEQPALVLITDVSRSRRDLDPRAIAAFLHARGYRLHTIGVGATSHAAGERDKRGALLYQPVNQRLMREIASAGGGGFYWADDADGLARATAAIQRAERREIAAEPRFVHQPLYTWPLLATLGWLAAWPFIARFAGRRWPA